MSRMHPAWPMVKTNVNGINYLKCEAYLFKTTILLWPSSNLDPPQVGRNALLIILNQHGVKDTVLTTPWRAPRCPSWRDKLQKWQAPPMPNWPKRVDRITANSSLFCGTPDHHPSTKPWAKVPEKLGFCWQDLSRCPALMVFTQSFQQTIASPTIRLTGWKTRRCEVWVGTSGLLHP